MTLREKQSLFVSLVGKLIQHAESLGAELTFGETWRPPAVAEYYERQGTGIASSLHCERLAVDLNLFVDGRYLSTTEDHRALGEWWEQQHPLCRWGGRFNDGNHYSLEHGGRQ